MKLISVDVDQLQLGMYVAKLDRAWLDTPFLFQGFRIDTDEVLEQVRRYCSHVYIDADRSDAAAVAGAAPAKKTRPVPQPRNNKRPMSRRGRSTIRLKASNVDHAATRELQALKAELPQARKALESTEHTVRELLDRIQCGKRFDPQKIESSIELMVNSISRNPNALVWVTRMKEKNDYLYDHSISSSIWAIILGRHLGLDNWELQLVSLGAMLMDVGKTKLDSELLIKRNITDDEMDAIKRHVDYSLEIVSDIKDIDSTVIDIISCHHERHDGTGYPNGMSGDEIPVFARFAGVIDTYDAMTQPRPYADPVSTFEAMRELTSLAGSKFASEVVEQFVQALGVFPVGTLVELNTGAVGVVIAQHKLRRLRPKVMLLLDEKKRPMTDFPIIDLLSYATDERSTVYIEHGLPPGSYGIDPAEYYL